jgi:uncharacterized membrane protein
MARTVEVAGAVPLDPEAAAALWRDLRRWSSFVEGLQRIEQQSPDWPQPGAKVVWVSGAGGRGRVTEKVLSSEPTAFSTRVHEERLSGTQAIVFEPAAGGGAAARLSLDYELPGAGPLKVVTDLLFIRRALRDSLTRTLRRFAVEAQEDAGLR